MFLRSGTTLAAASAFPGGGQSQARPNILLLIADQFRADCLGVAGNAAIYTPNVDRLARSGILFRNAWSSTPTCTPARAALLTGMAPWNHGMLGYGTVAEHYPIEMPRLLHDVGYYTTGIGKMHWHPQRATHGFDEILLDESGRVESKDFRSDYRSWFLSESPDADPDATGIDWNSYEARPYALPENLHPTAWIGDTAVRFLYDYARSQPFFLKVSFERPHSPYDPPRRWWDRYSGPLPAAQSGAWAEKFKPRSGADSTIWHGDIGSELTANARRGYYGSVSFVDEQIGRIVNALELRGWLRNTLILFTADHGDMLVDQHLWRKSYAYNGSARIPMILHWPDSVPAASPCLKPIEIRDILPTMLNAAGAPIPSNIDGASLLSIARNPEAEWRQWIDLEHDVCYSPENHWNALTDGRRKYIFHAQTGEEQFFDLEADPRELNDLPESPEVPIWRERLVTYLAARGPGWVRDGKLQLRPKGQLYSPHYPG
jgi:arylsulfatase A-like enzyme